MPDESQNTQNPTGDQSGEGQSQDQQTNEQKGGPSDVEKMRRLERELAEVKEREAKYKSAYENRQTQPNDDNDGENYDKGAMQKLEGKFRSIAVKETVTELEGEISKLPKELQAKVKENPFNPAWVDEKVLEYEMIGVDPDDPEACMEAAKRAARKSIPQFVEGFVEKPQGEKTEEQGLGNNPPLDQGNAFNGGKDLAQLSDAELEKIVKMGK